MKKVSERKEALSEKTEVCKRCHVKKQLLEACNSSIHGKGTLETEQCVDRYENSITTNMRTFISDAVTTCMSSSDFLPFDSDIGIYQDGVIARRI